MITYTQLSTNPLPLYSSSILKSKHLLTIIEAIETNNQDKLQTICNSYSSKILAKANFTWFDKKNCTTYKDANLLLICCFYGNALLLETLLATNIVDIDEYYGEDHNTLLMIAAQNSHTKIIRLLLANDANWRLTNTKNNRADQIQLSACRIVEKLELCKNNICLFLERAKKTDENFLLATGETKFMVTGDNYIEINYFNENNNFIISYFTKDVYSNIESEYNDRFEDAVTSDPVLAKYITKVIAKRNYLPDDAIEYLNDTLLEELPENIPEELLENSLEDFDIIKYYAENYYNYKDFLINIFMYRACVEIPLLAKLPNQEAIAELNRISEFI